jgi:hypothetical protein
MANTSALDERLNWSKCLALQRPSRSQASQMQGARLNGHVKKMPNSPFPEIPWAATPAVLALKSV